tara:strand:- start:55024 stop:55722 length:699 start_codon:yes stop_codon:yes gene_type:complete
MNDKPDNTNQSGKDSGKEPGMSAENSAHLRDLLISRVIDGSASPEDWSSFRILAASDAEVWTDLSDAQREHEALCEVMNAASSIADRVDLPGGSGSPLVFESRVTTTARWGGWAIAAVLLLGWYTGSITMNTSEPSPANTASLIPISKASPEQAMDQYMHAGQQSGQVVGEMPNQIVIETRPMKDGTIEVTFIRQIIERRVLDQAYRETVDEFGNPIAVPVNLDSLKNRKPQ